MFSFSSALWLAAASAMITAEVSARYYYPIADCESNGLKFRCAHTVICEDDSRTTLQCDWGDVINIHSVNNGQLDGHRGFNNVLKDPCHSSVAMSRVAKLCNGFNLCDVNFHEINSFAFDCAESKCLEVFYFCGPQVNVCEKNGANIRCDAGDVIRVQSAYYAEHDKSVCSDTQTRNIQEVCSPPNPLAKVSKMCDGKNNCVIRADSDAFVNPCKDTDKSLALSYSCIGTL